MKATVIIPTFDEALRIAATIGAALAAGAAEVIVADGGSGDGTRELALAHGARVIEGETLRARQLNRGAEAAEHELLVFLHADTRLPSGAIASIAAAVERGAIFGGFRLRFAEESRRLNAVAALINLRTTLTREPWGDQAQFTTKEWFAVAGGFRDLPIMEDYDLARRMKRLGRTVLLTSEVATSGRRFLQRGVLRTAILNWTIIAAYHAGVAPERLARWYRGGSSQG